MKSSLWSALGDVLVPATSKYRQDQVAPTVGMLQLVLPRAQDTLSAETGDLWHFVMLTALPSACDTDVCRKMTRVPLSEGTGAGGTCEFCHIWGVRSDLDSC